MTTHPNLVGLFESSIRDHWEKPALTDYGGSSFTFRETAEQIARYHAIFKACDIRHDDKIALLGKNSATWGIVYLATVTYGAVIVPILPDFKPKDVHYIVNHSDSLILFVEETILKDLDLAAMPGLRIVMGIPDLKIHFTSQQGLAEVLAPVIGTIPEISKESLSFKRPNEDDIAVISYTSGTTGFSKGVVLQHKSLLANILYAHRNMPLESKDRILSFLPMAHTFGCTFEFIFPFTLGCEITFLNKIPSPTTILTAFGDIRPALILTVPLMIEKIYKTRIKPSLKKPPINILIHIPGLNQLIFKKIHRKLYEMFGGNLKELVIGGAPFNPVVERFFRKIKFPYTVGYGMTECGPLISYASWRTNSLGASGRIVDELEMRIDSEDPLRIAGEIMVRGRHVMKEYYKNPEATGEVIDKDGWLHTGDMALLDEQGNIHIRGRSKSILLGASGQNIYPEEIESILNNRSLVMDSLVVQRDHKLVALIFPDAEAMEKAGITEDQLPHIFKGYIHDLNHQVPKYMRISDFVLQKTEFEKTPKRNPKRFLYT